MMTMGSLIKKECLYQKNSFTDNDWRYSDERMYLRAEIFRALKHYLDDHTRKVYEFCDLWVNMGNKDCTNIDKYFKMYLEEQNTKKDA